MKTTSPSRSELKHQYSLLSTTVGLEGSGAMRYGAAMFFYNAGLICDDLLEIYRICSKFDREDPIDLAHFEGVSHPSIDTSRAVI